jgi:hypothetical protein
MSPTSLTISGRPIWSASEKTTGMLSIREGITTQSQAASQETAVVRSA